ncbi:hypothetical protein PMAYCL1PPCAC_32395, partial [Pristionchus mayeri]
HRQCHFLHPKMNLLMILTIGVCAALAIAQKRESCAATVCPIGSTCSCMGPIAVYCRLPPNSNPLAQVCPKANYEFKGCSSVCPLKCGETKPSCETSCGLQKCQCKEGFYL